MNAKIRRWLAWLLTLAVLGYAGLTAAAWLFVKVKRGVHTVNYSDIALPWRWPVYQVKRGEHAIGLALNHLQAGKFDQGFYQLRVGMARAPAHKEGRLLWAQILANSRRYDLAQNILQDGLRFHRTDPAYVGVLLDFLLARQADEHVLALADQLLAAGNQPTELTGTVAIRAAQAAYYRGRYDLADSYLRKGALDGNLSAELLSARMDWDRGYRDLALLNMRQLHLEHPEHEGIYVQLSDILRQEERLAEARRVNVIHLVAHPNCPRAAIDHLQLLNRENRDDEIRTATTALLERFAAHPAGLLALGDFAATTGRVDLAVRLREQAESSGDGDVTAFQLMAVEALLVATRYAEARDAVQMLLKQPALAPALNNVAQGLLAIAHYGLGDPVSGQSTLMALMVRPDLRADSLLAIANRLVTMERRGPARDILARAVALDPQNQAALARMIELDLAAEYLAPLPDNLRRLLTLRKPPRHVLASAHRLLRQDRFLFLTGRDALLDELGRALARTTGTTG